MKYLAIIALFALAGCGAAGVYADQAVRMTTEAVDNAGQIEKRGPCLVRLGTWARMSPAEKKLIMEYAEQVCP